MKIFDPKKVVKKKVKETTRRVGKLPTENKIILLPGRLTNWKGQLIRRGSPKIFAKRLYISANGGYAGTR